MYEDLDLRIQSDGNRFAISARRGAQIATEPFELDRHRIPTLENLESGSNEAAKRAGSVLFEALIRGKVRDLYHQTCGATTEDSSDGFRIRIHFDPRDERLRPLIVLPWEVLCDPSAPVSTFLALDPRRPIVRVIDSIEPIVTNDTRRLEHVLVVRSTPANADSLDLDRESEAIRLALAKVSLHPLVLNHATLQGLHETITDDEPQVIHFMGHGELDSTTGQGFLVLESAAVMEDHLQASTFAAFFKGRSMPGLVVLSACLTAGSIDERRAAPFASVATSLAAAGLPAIIAMQSEIDDESAIRFADRLYTRLVLGAPIEAAVADARQAMFVEPRSPYLDWASPVLFMRGPAASPAPPDHATDGSAFGTAPEIHMPVITGKVDHQINVAYAGNVYQHGSKERK